MLFGVYNREKIGSSSTWWCSGGVSGFWSRWYGVRIQLILFTFVLFSKKILSISAGSSYSVGKGCPAAESVATG